MSVLLAALFASVIVGSGALAIAALSFGLLRRAAPASAGAKASPAPPLPKPSVTDATDPEPTDEDDTLRTAAQRAQDTASRRHRVKLYEPDETADSTNTAGMGHFVKNSAEDRTEVFNQAKMSKEYDYLLAPDDGPTGADT